MMCDVAVAGVVQNCTGCRSGRVLGVKVVLHLFVCVLLVSIHVCNCK